MGGGGRKRTGDRDILAQAQVSRSLSFKWGEEHMVLRPVGGGAGPGPSQFGGTWGNWLGRPLVTMCRCVMARVGVGVAAPSS